MEDELQCLQHSREWLGERGGQLARRDSDLAGDALREVGLVEAAWTSVTELITHGYAAAGGGRHSKQPVHCRNVCVVVFYHTAFQYVEGI